MFVSMLDEFKAVKYFKKLKGLKLLQVKAQAYVEPQQASVMKIFCEY